MTSAATSGTGGYSAPSWVLNVREEIGRSPAWEVGIELVLDGSEVAA